MSDLVTMRLALRSEAFGSWAPRIEGTLRQYGLSLDHTTQSRQAVTDGRGVNVEWFESGPAAWEWLQTNDGLMSIWGKDDMNLGIALRHPGAAEADAVVETELDLVVDLPQRSRHDRERMVRTAEELAKTIMKRCQGSRAVAYDEALAEGMSGSSEFLLTDGGGAFPRWLGYWNAFEQGTLSTDLGRRLVAAGASVEAGRALTLVRLACWPWGVKIDDVIRISRVLIEWDRNGC